MNRTKKFFSAVAYFCLALVVLEGVIEYVTVYLILTYPVAFNKGVAVHTLQLENKMQSSVDPNEFQNSALILTWISVYSIALGWSSPINSFCTRTIDTYISAYGNKPFLYTSTMAQNQVQDARASLGEITHVFFTLLYETVATFFSGVTSSVSSAWTSFRNTLVFSYFRLQEKATSNMKGFYDMTGISPVSLPPADVFNALFSIATTIAIMILFRLIKALIQWRKQRKENQ